MNYKKIIIGCIIVIIHGVIIGWLGFPELLKKMIKKQVTLKPDSQTRKMWEKFPIPVDFKVNVFNITNPGEVQRGGKPILQEIGPFVFEEWKDKYNLEDNEADDTVTYNARNTFYFREDMSNGLTGEEIITIPHPLIQLFAIAIKRDKPPMINLIAEGLTTIFNPTTPFITGKFMDIFFRGFPIDCSSTSFAATSICLQFHTGEVKGSAKINETHFSFGLLAAGNYTDAGQFTVLRGLKVSADVGKILKYNDEDELSVWDEEGDCNMIRGTDGTIFPPLKAKNDALWMFGGEFCRSLGAMPEKKSSYAGIPTVRYVVDFGDPKNEPNHHCFCKSYPDDCPAKGTFDISLCTGGPMSLSLPHFYNSDPSLREDVDGMKPNRKEHELYLEMETISGTPLSAAKRLQFNLDVEPIPELEVMKNLRKLKMPLFWVEEGAHLNKTFTDLLKNSLFLFIKLNDVFKWCCLVLGIAGIALAVYMDCSRTQVKPVITEVEKKGQE